jgi:hypothetical protein
MDCSGPMRKCRWRSQDPNRCGLSERTYETGPRQQTGASIVRCLSWGLFYVVCKVAISTAAPVMRQEVRQLSQQVMIASSTIPLELCYEYSTRYDSPDLQKVQEKYCDDTVDGENKDIVISEIMARAIKGEAEFAFLGEEFTSTEGIKPVICDRGATSTLSSSFENCTDGHANPRQLRSRRLKEGLLWQLCMYA